MGKNYSFWTRFFNFDEFITSGLIRIIYIAGSALMLLAAISVGVLPSVGSLIIALGSFSLSGILLALFFLTFSLISGALGMLLLRVYCELLIAIFKINENLQVIREKKGLE